MPPKRSRRKQATQRPPLEFTDSPVHLVHHLPSPVLPCDHPAHADVVPVELGTSVWVSPQFQNAKSTLKKRRRNRQTQRSGEATLVSSGPEVDINTDRTQRTGINRNYIPLQMFGENEEDPPVQTEQEEHNNDTPKLLKRSQAKRQSTADIRIPSVTRVLKPLLNSSQKERSQSDSAANYTQVRPKKDIKKTLRSKLSFNDSDSDVEDTSRINIHLDKRVVNGKNLENWDSFCEEAFGEVNTPVGKTMTPLPQLRAIEGLKRSGRVGREQGYFSQLLETPPASKSKQKSESEQPKVLAYDTPESEYGKSLRWRQRHKRIYSRNTNDTFVSPIAP